MCGRLLSFLVGLRLHPLVPMSASASAHQASPAMTLHATAAPVVGFPVRGSITW